MQVIIHITGEKAKLNIVDHDFRIETYLYILVCKMVDII